MKKEYSTKEAYNLTAARFEEALYSLIETLNKAGFNPSQPRVPAGEPNDGQWTDGGFNNPKEPKLPNLRVPREEHFNTRNVITILSAIPATRAATSIIKAVRVWRGVSTVLDKRTLRIMNNIEKYFSGQPKTFYNKKGDIIMIKDNKKIRFDLEGHGYKPHFHIQEYVDGEWIDIGKHHNYFKDLL